MFVVTVTTSSFHEQLLHIPFDISEVIKRACCSGGNRVSKITIHGLDLHGTTGCIIQIVPVDVMKAWENGGMAPLIHNLDPI
jgi:hypothetical protein